jgi:hypothetical protein
MQGSRKQGIPCEGRGEEMGAAEEGVVEDMEISLF